MSGITHIFAICSILYSFCPVLPQGLVFPISDTAIFTGCFSSIGPIGDPVALLTVELTRLSSIKALCSQKNLLRISVSNMNLYSMFSFR